ncbi:16S rRNA (guanine(966)-N(2))-methyltransferase RsmD [Alkalihalobacterium alkalinitrilicum]|uniref:16S rRNA (guanine(966)-N(2))-methyltransferase RsmD n=1 Tax=Alkalihalobacterium alkalinitrilicum TaxID=427920 RepID=UPI000994D6EA|nr:16S rRNA (guanine(966)-N(2))-methyltransferase RsmD [Alkalihalobacterium alkalinitrilicum]
MRVISGEKKGQPLKAVPGSTTRPTTDKVKESIFNIIGPYFYGGWVLDLYGGSGNLGIEALSRGVEKAIFVDQNRKAIDIIKENLSLCSFSDRAEVYRNDAKRALKALIKREISFTYIFLDPPYAEQKIEAEIGIINDFQLLENGGTIVAEHAASIELAKYIGSFSCKRREVYGDTAISFYMYD